MLLLLSASVVAQPLRPPAGQTPDESITESGTPLIFPEAANEPGEESVEEVVLRLQEEMRAIAQSSMNAAERKAALDEMLTRNSRVLKSLSTEWDDNRPRSVDEAASLLEQMIFELALEIAPDKDTRSFVKDTAPAHMEFEPNRPLLIAPRSHRQKIVVTRDAEEKGLIVPWWRTTKFDTEALALNEIKESPEQSLEPAEENAEEKVKVEVLKDEKVTVEMHDDTTILRAVEADSGDLVLFDALHLWIGGAAQGDAYYYDDLFNAGRGGGDENDTAVRRAEVIVRSTLFDWGEIKLQYDLDANIWRDLYYRRVDEEKARTITIGNQTEPMAQENTLGNKFTTAMEQSAPTSTFAANRGLGVRVNRWFEREPTRQWFEFGDGSTSYITTTLGVFGEDIENTNDTDIALTGRVTMGRERVKGSGLHLGFAATLRDGEFDQVAPRPEVQEAARIQLASFDADQLVVLGFETMYTLGSLHAEAQAYYADYRGGDEDATGYGGYAQVGYFLTGQERGYRPKWGLWAPLTVGKAHAFEVFARASYTYGNTDDDSSNDLRLLTVGGSWYWRKFRASINGIYGEVDQDINDEDTGLGVTARIQYLF